MATDDTSKVSNADLGFLNISEVDPKQLYHKVETTINGVTKKILVPVMRSHQGEDGSSSISSPVAASSSGSKEPVPITIAPQEDSETDDNLGQCRIQISNVTSLEPFISQQKDASKRCGRARGRRKKHQNGQQKQRCVSRARNSAKGKKPEARIASSASTRNVPLNDPEVLKDIIFALMSERISLQKDLLTTSSKQDTSNIILEHPDIAAHQGKMLIHIGQNPDGSHIYKTYDIGTNKNDQQPFRTQVSASNNTNIAVTMMSSGSAYPSPLVSSQNSPSQPSGQCVQAPRNCASAAFNLPVTVRPTVIVPSTTGSNVIIPSNGHLLPKQKNIPISQAGLQSGINSALGRNVNKLPSEVNSPGTSFGCGTPVVQSTKRNVAVAPKGKNVGFSQVPLAPLAGYTQVSACPQLVHVLQTGSQLSNTQSGHSTAIIPHNQGCSSVVSKENAVVIGPHAVGGKQITVSALQPVRVVETGVVGGAQPVGQGNNFTQSGSLCATSSSSNMPCQQPSVLKGYFNNQGQLVVEASVLSPNQHLPVIVNNAAQPKSTAASLPSLSPAGTNCNGNIPVKQNAAILANQGLQPTAIYSLGVCTTNQSSTPNSTNNIAATKHNQLKHSCIIQGRNVTNQVVQPPGAQIQSTLLNSIYSTATVSVVGSGSPTVISSQNNATKPTAAKTGMGSNVPVIGQLHVNSSDTLTVRIGDVDIATLLNLARRGGVKGTEVQNEVFNQKNKSSVSTTGKQPSPSKQTRRQVDINVGRERTIYPKTSDANTLSHHSMPVISLNSGASRYASFPKGIPSGVPGLEQTVTKSSETSSEDQSGQGYCPIVNQIKQDLALLGKKDHRNACARSVPQYLIKPCSVVLEKMHLDGRSSVNLKRSRQFAERNEIRAKKRKQGKDKPSRRRLTRRSRRIH